MYSFPDKTFSPALVNSEGTLVAAMCRGAAGKKWGYIEIITQTSADGGISWSEAKTVLQPPARAISRDAENTKSAFFLNPVLASAPNGDIVMLVTFFPESKGAADSKYLEKKKTAFTYFDGERHPIIYDRDGSYYIIMNDGAVIDKTKAKTAFTVDAAGELYKDDEYMGNIYLNGAQGKSETEGKTTFGSLLKTPKRSYIFMLKSSDKGNSWSNPVNITPNLDNENDGPLLMTASGSGITTSDGRIIMPLYSPKGAVAVYSDDNGDTWNRNPRMPYTGGKGDTTFVQTPDKLIHGFNCGRNAVSDDNGILWSKGGKLPSSIADSKKSAVLADVNIFAAAKTKKGGVLATADLFSDKKGNYKEFKWRKELIPIEAENFDSPCIVKIKNNVLGVAYEVKEKAVFRLITIE
ncbi:MAG: glycoside hydrolase [Eubacterium sp.]|nr:glycoside hydrolase [Eubacterium sp.]